MKVMEDDFLEAIQLMSDDNLEGKSHSFGISNGLDRQLIAETVGDSFRTLIQKFKDKYTEETSEAIMTEHGLKCNCKEWHQRKCCKHTIYVFDKLSIRDEHGRVIGIYSKTVNTEASRRALAVDFGRNTEEVEKWALQDIAVLEI